MNKITKITMLALLCVFLCAVPALAAPNDVIISGQAATSTIPNAPEPLYIIAGVQNTFNYPVEVHLYAFVNSFNGWYYVYCEHQEWTLTVPANSADTHVFEFYGIVEAGDYDVTVWAPTQEKERGKHRYENNYVSWQMHKSYNP